MKVQNLEAAAREALSIDMVVDITTIGRRSGQPRRIEIWCHLMDGQLFLAASPGPRSWYANLFANSDVVLHLKDQVKEDIAVSARPVTEEAERRDVFTRLAAQSAFRQGQGLDVEPWVAGSKLVELIPTTG